MKAWFFNILLALDILGSAILRGLPGETLSGRAGTAQRQGHWRGYFWSRIINWLARNPLHCAQAIAGDIARAKAVIVDDQR